MTKDNSAYKEFICPYTMKKHKVKMKKEVYDRICVNGPVMKGLPVMPLPEKREELERAQKTLEAGYGKRLKKESV